MASPPGPRTLRLGDVRLDLLDDGEFRLDGGAMFRVVPKVLWERTCPPDERNRIRLAMRPLLVRVPVSGAPGRERVILVDCGIGAERRDAKMTDQLAIAPGVGLEASLAALGLGPGDVDLVVLTHLHFDHAGGLVRPDSDGGERLRFPNARVIAQRLELEDSRDDCPLCRASYRADDTRAVREAGLLELVAGDGEVAPGVRVEVTGGHTRAHQLVRIEAGGEAVVFWGDLIPTAAHLRPHYVMALDLDPRQAWARKAALVPRAADEGWIGVFYHDLHTPLGRVLRDGRGYRVEPVG